MSRSGTGRLSVATMYDPNDMAHFFVTLFPLSLPFVQRDHPLHRRIVAALIIFLSPVLILLTGSRGGFLALLVAIFLLIFTGLAGIRKSHKKAILTSLILLIAIFGSRIDIERYRSLTDLSNDYNISSDSGRFEIWKTGLKLIKNHPITGVGFGSFGRAHGYLRGAEDKIPIWRAAHNSYIQLCADLGVPAFLVFMSLIIGSVRNFLAHRNIEPSTPEHEEAKSLSGIFLIALAPHLIAAFFVNQGYTIFFPLFFALSATIKRLHYSDSTRHRN
jgi:O-antigen ligase